MEALFTVELTGDEIMFLHGLLGEFTDDVVRDGFEPVPESQTALDKLDAALTVVESAGGC